MRKASSSTDCTYVTLLEEGNSEQETITANQSFLSIEDELELAKNLPKPTTEEIEAKKVYLGEKTKRYTLFLDLDETLVYSRGRQKLGSKSLKVVIRPYVEDFLRVVEKLYEIVVFSAGGKDYVEKVANLIDPNRKYFKKVLSNEHCIQVAEGRFVKDLRIIQDRRMDEMLIVDNSIISFINQIANGVHIVSYFGEEDDKEIGYLGTYLSELYGKENIVKTNEENMCLVK